MTKQNVSEIEKGGGYFLGLVNALMDAARCKSVPFSAIYRLVTKAGGPTVDKMVDLAHADWLAEQPKLVEQPQPVEPVPQTGGHPYRGGPPVEQTDFFTSLLDADVPAEHQATLAKYRVLAREHGVSDSVPLCWRVRAGFTLKHHAPKMGNCYQGFEHLQDWKFEDEPTRDCLVFWVPRLLKGGTDKTKDQQIKFLAELRTKRGLPEYHLTGFGSASLLAGLILAHFAKTGERVPLNS